MTPFLPDDEKLAAVRAALPATSAGIYLDTPARGPIPAEVHRAMAELADWELAVGRGSDDHRLEALQRMDEARAAVAAAGVADPEAIGLVHRALDGLDVAARIVDWRRGDRALTVGVSASSANDPIAALRERLGVERSAVAVQPGEDDDRIVEAVEAALVPGTRLVWLAHVAADSGTVLPVGRLVELGHARGAVVAVDGTQAFGAIPVDLGRLAADVYAIPAETWLLGPDGIGAVHVGPAVVDRARRLPGPTFGAGASDRGVGGGRDPRLSGDDPAGFHRPSVTGFARSVAWLSMYVGWTWIHGRAARLTAATAVRLAEIDGVELVTPRDRMATVLVFRIRGWAADAAVDELSRRTSAILGLAPGGDAIRIGIGFFNDEGELERFAAGVELLAAHRPETLPPRQVLTILGQD